MSLVSDRTTNRRAGARLAVMALVLTACSNPAASSAVPDRDFELRAGESVRLEGSDLVLRFVSVPSDSRCPTDVQCVHAGDATVRLHAQGGGAPDASLDLHTNDEPKEGAQGSFLVRLLGLRPLPRAGRPVPAADFVATLRVTRRP